MRQGTVQLGTLEGLLHAGVTVQRPHGAPGILRREGSGGAGWAGGSRRGCPT